MLQNPKSESLSLLTHTNFKKISLQPNHFLSFQETFYTCFNNQNQSILSLKEDRLSNLLIPTMYEREFIKQRE